jgi:hypothetical protein
MSLHTELGLTGAYDYKDSAPTALPGGDGGRGKGPKVK